MSVSGQRKESSKRDRAQISPLNEESEKRRCVGSSTPRSDCSFLADYNLDESTVIEDPDQGTEMSA